MKTLTRFITGTPRAVLKVERETKTQYILSDKTRVSKRRLQPVGDSDMSVWFHETIPADIEYIKMRNAGENVSYVDVLNKFRTTRGIGGTTVSRT